MPNQKVIDELDRISKCHGGHLIPEEIVKAAERESSPLHSWFNWDDTEAARKYRIIQARQLIVTVSYIGGKNLPPVHQWVSLRTDRHKGLGYRATVTVLSNKQLRRQLIADALAEMQAFQRKYANVRELAEVFEAMKQSQSKLAKVLNVPKLKKAS